MEYQKVKSVPKQVITKGPALSRLVLKTMKTISEIVGDTLGPGGRPVMIERFEHAIPPMITKDGVTVFRSLGFTDPVQHCVMETARDTSVRTASEAGDGTTTAAILAEAVVRFADKYLTAHPQMSPQKVVRHMEAQFRDVIQPLVKQEAIKVDLSADGLKLLRAVAKISANGDEPLADAVMKCFEIVGDDGNVTIAEVTGSKSGYEVEEIKGYSIPMGYEESCGNFYPKFINDAGAQMCRMENPVYILYHGHLTDINTALTLLCRVGDQFESLVKGEQTDYRHPFVVFVASSFSDQVLATFSAGWGTPGTIRIFPLTIPKSPFANATNEFLNDLAAVTGANVFDPINKPLDLGTLDDLGPGTAGFEVSRFRATIVGRPVDVPNDDGTPTAYYEDRLIERVDIVTQQLEQAGGEYDRRVLQERLGKLTGGIAKLRVIGASNGELKEKRDRAEDAVCAVRGAMKHGCLPGGGWMLLKAASALESNPVNDEIIKPALMEPVNRLLLNCGLSEHEMRKVMTPIFEGIRDGKHTIYDAYNQMNGDAIELGVLDSTPAVLEAMRNSISNASLLGTLGGIVVFARDNELERTEARATQDWLRNANVNEADERG